jgi:ComF family protein
MGLRAALPFLHTVLDTLLPPHCLTCDTLVDAPGRFCPACFRQTSFITAPLCLACGVPFAHARHDAIVCDDCAIDPPPWGEARAALAYDAHSRRLVLGFKHGDRTELAGALARMMARAGAALLGRAEVLVPVPLHRGRLLARRFNQSALLARALGRIAGVAVAADALRRVRATAPLGTLSAGARARMLEGAIAVRRPAAVAGRHVLLVDDVLTSGATARTCTRALLAAGAAGVDVLVAARVRAPGARDGLHPG